MVDSAGTSRNDEQPRDKGPAIRPEVPARLIEHVEVTVDAVLGQASIKVAELALLKPGSVLELDRQLNEAVEIQLNGRVIGRGEIVTVDDKFAVRITEMG